MQNIKNYSNEHLQNRNVLTERKNKWEKGEWDSQGVQGGHVNTAIFKMDNQQGPTIQYMELCSMLCNNSNGKRS